MNAERAMNGKTWGWDGTTWRELSATGTLAANRSGIAYDAARREVVLFGGSGSRFHEHGRHVALNGQAWREAKVPGRLRAGWGYMTYDRARGVTVLFGRAGEVPEDADVTRREWNRH
jgi:hypothetical protein